MMMWYPSWVVGLHEEYNKLAFGLQCPWMVGLFSHCQMCFGGRNLWKNSQCHMTLPLLFSTFLGELKQRQDCSDLGFSKQRKLCISSATSILKYIQSIYESRINYCPINALLDFIVLFLMMSITKRSSYLIYYSELDSTTDTYTYSGFLFANKYFLYS